MQEEIVAKLYKYCAYQDRCTSEVIGKLWDWGIPGWQHDEYLAHLEDERFLDDARFVRSFVRGKFYHKSWGKEKIRHELRKKQVPKSLVEAGLAEEIEEEAYQNKVQDLAEKKWQQLEGDPHLKRKEKVVRYLLQKGYLWDEFRTVVDQLNRPNP